MRAKRRVVEEVWMALPGDLTQGEEAGTQLAEREADEDERAPSAADREPESIVAKRRKRIAGPAQKAGTQVRASSASIAATTAPATSRVRASVSRLIENDRAAPRTTRRPARAQFGAAARATK
jgi:hypothetical protein